MQVVILIFAQHQDLQASKVRDIEELSIIHPTVHAPHTDIDRAALVAEIW